MIEESIPLLNKGFSDFTYFEKKIEWVHAITDVLKESLRAENKKKSSIFLAFLSFLALKTVLCGFYLLHQ
jgi:hypothetical protein